MLNEKLLNYIKQRFSQGAKQEEIKKALVAGGWPEAQVNEALSFTAGQSQLEPGIAPAKLEPPANSMPGGLAIFSETLELYKKRFKTLVGIVAVPLIAQFLIGLISVIIFLVGAWPGLAKEPEKNLDGILTLITSWPVLLALIVIIMAVIILQLWSQVALIAAINNNPPGIGIVESFRQGWRKLLSCYWLAILSGFFIFGGFILFFVPGLIMAVWFSFAVFILVTENEKGFKALIKSREYVRGSWGRVFWRLLVLGFLMLAIMLGALLAYFLLNLVAVLLTPLLSPFISWIYQIAITFLLGPISVIYLFLLYKHLRNQKGDFVCQPTKKQKVGFTLIGLAGIIFITVILVSTILMLNHAFTQTNTAPTAAPAPFTKKISVMNKAQNKARDAMVKANVSMARTIMRLA